MSERIAPRHRSAEPTPTLASPKGLGDIGHKLHSNNTKCYIAAPKLIRSG